MSAKPITQTLAMLQRGAFSADAGDKFAQLVKSVEETGNAGKLTITIDVKKAGAALQVTAKCTDKSPEAAPESDLFWATNDGNLSIQNPAQQNLDLRDASGPTKTIRDLADPATGEIRSAG